MKNKGITLIALIITIIIMLILAGISLNIATGDKGLIKRAKESKKQAEIADIRKHIMEEIVTQQTINQDNLNNQQLKEIINDVVESTYNHPISKYITSYGERVDEVTNSTRRRNNRCKYNRWI